VIVDLKDAAVPSFTHMTASISAFPEDIAKRLRKNPRVVMWDSTWPTGERPAAYFYEHSAFIVFTEGGELTSSIDGGALQALPIALGQLVFRPGGHALSERSTSDGIRGIVVELK
jgi:hypothetical protein